MSDETPVETPAAGKRVQTPNEAEMLRAGRSVESARGAEAERDALRARLDGA